MKKPETDKRVRPWHAAHVEDVDLSFHNAGVSATEDRSRFFLRMNVPQACLPLTRKDALLVRDYLCHFLGLPSEEAVRAPGAHEPDPVKEALSPMARRALERPANFESLSGQEQWDIDKKLGILDWNGQ